MDRLTLGLCATLTGLGIATGASAAPSAPVDGAASAEVRAHRGKLPAPRGESRTFEYVAASGKLESTLVVKVDAQGGERLTGETRLYDGTRLTEAATFDRTGRLVRAEIMLACASGRQTLVLDPIEGIVEARTESGTRRQRTPTDFPWLWVPRSCSRGAALATPLSALVALRSVPTAGAGRLIDLDGLTSHTIMSDQVVVREDAHSDWVVLGDDAILVRDGLPRSWTSTLLGEIRVR